MDELISSVSRRGKAGEYVLGERRDVLGVRCPGRLVLRITPLYGGLGGSRDTEYVPSRIPGLVL